MWKRRKDNTNYNEYDKGTEIPFNFFNWFSWIICKTANYYGILLKITDRLSFFLALVVRFITRRYIGDYDPTLEKVYTFHTVIDNEMVYFDILDTAGQPNVSKIYFWNIIILAMKVKA